MLGPLKEQTLFLTLQPWGFSFLIKCLSSLPSLLIHHRKEIRKDSDAMHVALQQMSGVLEWCTSHSSLCTLCLQNRTSYCICYLLNQRCLAVVIAVCVYIHVYGRRRAKGSIAWKCYNKPLHQNQMEAVNWFQSLTLAVPSILSEDKALWAPAQIGIPIVHTDVLTAMLGWLADILPWGKCGEMNNPLL